MRFNRNSVWSVTILSLSVSAACQRASKNVSIGQCNPQVSSNNCPAPQTGGGDATQGSDSYSNILTNQKQASGEIKPVAGEGSGLPTNTPPIDQAMKNTPAASTQEVKDPKLPETPAPSTGDTNKQTTGDTNKQTTGDTNKQTNGDTNKQTNGDTNKQTTTDQGAFDDAPATDTAAKTATEVKAPTVSFRMPGEPTLANLQVSFSETGASNLKYTPDTTASKQTAKFNPTTKRTEVTYYRLVLSYTFEFNNADCKGDVIIEGPTTNEEGIVGATRCYTK